MSELPSMRAKGQAPDAKQQGPVTPEKGRIVNNTPLPRRILEGAKWLITGAPTTGMQLEDLHAQVADLTSQKERAGAYLGASSGDRHREDGKVIDDIEAQLTAAREKIKQLGG